MDDCPNCANLQATISRLTSGVAGALTLINVELEKPTMSRTELIHHVQERLFDTLHSGT